MLLAYSNAQNQFFNWALSQGFEHVSLEADDWPDFIFHSRFPDLDMKPYHHETFGKYMRQKFFPFVPPETPVPYEPNVAIASIVGDELLAAAAIDIAKRLNLFEDAPYTLEVTSPEGIEKTVHYIWMRKNTPFSKHIVSTRQNPMVYYVCINGLPVFTISFTTVTPFTSLLTCHTVYTDGTVAQIIEGKDLQYREILFSSFKDFLTDEQQITDYCLNLPVYLDNHWFALDRTKAISCYDATKYPLEHMIQEDYEDFGRNYAAAISRNYSFSEEFIIQELYKVSKDQISTLGRPLTHYMNRPYGSEKYLTKLLDLFFEEFPFLISPQTVNNPNFPFKYLIQGANQYLHRWGEEAVTDTLQPHLAKIVHHLNTTHGHEIETALIPTALCVKVFLEECVKQDKTKENQCFAL